MDGKLQGIVLQSIRYGDTSLIVKVYTRDFGLQSYMIKGALSRTSKSRAAFFQPLNVIEFVTGGKNLHGALGYVKDVQMAFFYQTLFSEMKKSAILMYVAELLSKSLTEQEQNLTLYDFILHSLQWLDLTDENYANFPLFFTLELSRFLGFYPKTNEASLPFFDMMEGHFVGTAPIHPYYLEGDSAFILSAMLNQDLEKAMQMPLNVVQRRNLLDGIITFMRLHAPFLKSLQSHEVLQTVLG